MKIKDKHYQTIWFEKDSSLVKIIDQTKLPHEFINKDIHNADEMVNAIFTMEVRGAPLIGGAEAFGVALAAKEKKDLNFIKEKGNDLIKSRPTAINLEWAVNRMINKLINVEVSNIFEVAIQEAQDQGFVAVVVTGKVSVIWWHAVSDMLQETRKNMRKVSFK